MANPSKLYTCFVLLTFLSSSIFTSSVLCDEATQALIDKICRRMEEYAFCNDAFQQNLKGSTANITALTQIAVEQTLSSASDTHEFIVGLLKNATDPAEKNALITCENAYNNVITFFQQATTAFNQEDYKSQPFYIYKISHYHLHLPPPPLPPTKHSTVCEVALETSSTQAKMVLQNDVDLLNPPAELEKKKHKLKRLVQSPNSFFMDVKCQGCFNITTVFSHSQTVVVCGNCQTVLCQPTGGRARLTEGCSFRKKGD
ncbi:40S ribosomal protein S27 [Hibiscus syriacus]|uniref:40S ribosomal protein S27 n=1 Tax=Hibiscus syriacus TaxID=106335 RepID=A0A6A3B673_HIBSY|nr:40S ribosomal protein S27 [Hibiscus syriacus]